MNIPQDTLQAVADAAFLPSSKIKLITSSIFDDWKNQDKDRRAVIQHALDNPALAPFLAGVGEYTDQAIYDAWEKAVEDKDAFPDRMRTFLAALPRRESPALAEAIARAEKAEAELAALKVDMSIAERAVDNVMRILPEMVKSPSWEDAATSVREHIDKLQNELAEAIARAEKAEAELAKSREINQGLTKSCLEWEKIVQELKSSQLGIFRPIAEMPETVPDGCMAVFRWRDDFGSWVTGTCKPTNGFFATLRLPAAEATPPVQAKHAAQVPLGPEDVPPGSVIRGQNWAIDWGKCWLAVLETTPTGVHCNRGDEYRFTSLHFGWQINTSIPDTGRWDANAWKPCSKPGKEVVK